MSDHSVNMTELGIIVIGRNEGERLRLALASLPHDHVIVVYVDSGSTDDSVQLAESTDAIVHALDPSRPFSPARARHEGVQTLLNARPDVRWIQFLDGDCSLEHEWLEQAITYLQAHDDVAIVCGTLSERHPDQSVYNRLSAAQWNSCFGDIKACGGIFLVRRDAYQSAGGFDERLTTGEEEELCSRIRANGGRVVRLNTAMAEHDSGLLTFNQWWNRAVWGGYGGALKFLTQQAAPFEKVRQLRKRLLWPIVVPAVGLAGLIASFWWTWSLVLSVACAAAFALLFIRIVRDRRRHGDPLNHAMVYAAFCILRKFAVAAGFLLFFCQRGETTARPDPHAHAPAPQPMNAPSMTDVRAIEGRS